MEAHEIRKIIDEAPDYCPITGLRKCESYTIDGNVVYLTSPAFDAYTLPEYDAETGEFHRIKYDMDDDFKDDYEYLCHVNGLKGRADFEEIKKFYEIE